MKSQTILLIVTIFVSVFLLSLLVKYEIKKTQKKKKKEEKPAPPKEEIKETPKEEPKDEKPIKEEKKELKTPPISVALLDELHEFQNYLKERVTPQNTTQENSLHPYDTPRFSALDDYSYQNFEQDLKDYDYMRRPKKRTSLEDLPNEIKILLFTNLFETKF